MLEIGLWENEALNFHNFYIAYEGSLMCENVNTHIEETQQAMKEMLQWSLIGNSNVVLHLLLYMLQYP